MAKKVDPQKKKQERQKLFVIVGGVLLVVVFAYEAMSLGLIGGKKAPPPPAVVTQTPGTAPNSLTPPGLPGAPAPTATPAAGELADTDVPPTTAGEGELVSFSMFQTKNPFSPQIGQTSNGGSSSGDSGSVVPASSGGSTPTAADAPTADKPTTAPTTPTTTPGATVTPSTTPAGGTTTTTTTAAPTETVAISVNGKTQRVGKDGTFPSGAPVFRLVSFGSGTAEVGIVGGSYQTGGQTLTLERGKSVTLMNTSDGKRYTLELL